MKRILPLLLAVAALSARAVVPADFAKTFTVTVPAGLVDAGETLASFPLLLRLGTGIAGFNYADFQQAGADILVQDASGNALPFELENWDTAGESRLWVRVPSVAEGTTLTVYYGTAETVAPPAGMWSGYAGVWHLNEAGDGATTIADSTANAQNGTSHASSKARSDGKLGAARGLELGGKNGAMATVPSSAVLDTLVPTFTVSGWVRPTTLAMNWGYLFARKTSDADPSWGLQFRASDNANTVGIYSNGNADNDSNRAMFTTSGKFTANTWTKYAVVYDDTTIRLYLDGALVASKSAVPGAAVNKSNGLGIGGFPTSENHSSLKADQDEVRLMNGAASAAWVASEYRQESGAVALSYGAVGDMDATVPVVAAPVLSRNPATGAFTVSAEISTNVPVSVSYDADGVTGAMATADAALPMTYSATLAGLVADTTYHCSVLAVSTGGSTISKTCPTAFYNGNLSVAKISDANETGLVPGSFRISRADKAYDLAVAYTVGGTAVSGRNYAALSGTATIPAGSNSVDIAVMPIFDAQLDADTTVVLTLAAGLYGIDENAGSATLTIVNHHVAEGLDFAKKMTLTPSEAVLATIGNSVFADFPVLVRLPAAASAEFRTADGSDLVVTDENGTSLPFEVDTFEPAGETLVWVKVPSLSAATRITAWFGGASNIDNNPTAVWSDYVGVWHMNEASGTVADATGNGLGASPAKATAVSVAQASGAVGTARQTATSDVKDYLSIPNYNSFDVGANFTFSCFYDATARKGYDRLVSRKEKHDDGNGWEVEMANSSTKLSARGASATSISGSFSDLVSSGWMRFAFVYSGTTLTAYLNGAQIGTGTIAAATDNGKPLSIGCDSDGSEAYFVGYVDEARLRKGAASTAEVALEYATMADATFFDQGAVEDVDATAQKFQTPTVVRNADGTYTVTVVLSENSGDVGTIYDAGATALTNVLATAAAPGTFTDTPANLTADTTYAFAAYGRNANGTEVVKEGGVFYNGELTVEKVSDAAENGLVPGVFRISRADTAHDLVVSYTVGGTATAGQTYAALSGTATIPAGSTHVDVEVVPLLDSATTENTTVSLALAAGLYGVDAQAGSAEMTVENLVVPAGFNTWVAAADGLASVGSNWSEGHAPLASENVLFDGRFSSANCEWDAAATATVASWTMQNDYAGAVTVDTVFPGKGDFQCLTVTGPMAVMSGVITHPQSWTQPQKADDCLQDLLDNETYRVRIDAGSIVIGPDGRIDALNKGYYHSNTGSHTSPEPSHGGRLSASGQAPYDDVKEPIHIGMPYKRASGNYTVGIGGGAVYLTSSGAIVVDGYVGADTGSDTWNRGYTLRGGAAAGSVYIRGASVTGTGTISASAVKTDEQNNRGVGGRIAVIATSATPIDYSTLQLKATVYPFKSGTSQSSTYGGCGTVFVKDGTMANGVLIVRNFDLTFAEDASGRRTDVTAEGDWTFDRLELGGGVQLSVPCGTTLTLPGWDCVTAPANSTGTGTPSGFIYRGGTLDFGSAASVSLAGHWYFAPISNYVFNADVSLADGAAIGFGGKFTQKIANNAYPDQLDRIHCTVNGDLTVPAGCAVNVNQAGAMQDSHGVPDDYPQGAHGGRRSNTMKTIGSAFHPQTLPHGQSNSYGWIIPGGAVELVVSGTLTLGGTIESTAYTGNDGTKSEVGGGSIDITAGRLAGDGSIKAGAVKDGQPGGRIAIRLTGAGATLGDFTGTINCSTMGNGGVGSCGSIYIETAADGDSRGTVIFDDNNVTCTTYTPICATGYEADDVADFRHADLVVRNQAKAQVAVADDKGTFTMDNVEIDETGALDLFGNRFVVTSARIGGKNVHTGTYTAAQLAALGFPQVVDTDENAAGTLVIRGAATVLIVK